MFPPPKKAKPKSILRRTPPPNYQHRSVKLKVFAVVAVVMAGLYVFEESRKKDGWQWFWRTPVENIEPNDRLLPPSRVAHDPPGTIVQTSTDSPAVTDELPEPTSGADAQQEPTPAELAWRQGWKEIYTLIDSTERTLLYEILAQSRGEHQLGPVALDQASKLVLKLDENWQAYAETAFQSLAELKPDERSTWEAILRTVNERWHKQTQPALEAAAQGQAVTGEQRAAADSFQQTLDRLNLGLVKDDTPLRADENDLWFRLMSRARRTPPQELAAQSQKGVTYLQLAEQSSHYRGELVTIEGTVRGAWKSIAISNPWGLKEFYVLWIHPAGGPNAPFIVHVATLPEGFPPIKERAADGKLPKMHEDVTVHAFFFKRQAYLAADGTRTAPLLLAHSVNWDQSVAAARASSRWEFTWPSFLAIVAGTLVVSLLASLLIYSRIRAEDRLHVHEEDIAHADLSALNNVDIGPSVDEGLKQLEQQFGRRD